MSATAKLGKQIGKVHASGRVDAYVGKMHSQCGYHLIVLHPEACWAPFLPSQAAGQIPKPHHTCSHAESFTQMQLQCMLVCMAAAVKAPPPALHLCHPTSVQNDHSQDMVCSRQTVQHSFLDALHTVPTWPQRFSSQI